MFDEEDYGDLDGYDMPRPDVQSEAWGRHRYGCPYCGSDNVLALNAKSIICGAAGGVLGGIITGFLAYQGDLDEKQIVTSSLVGALSGVAVGVRFGQSGKKDIPQRVLFCADCFHFFNSETET
jgi:hypothetical protein